MEYHQRIETDVSENGILPAFISNTRYQVITTTIQININRIENNVESEYSSSVMSPYQNEYNNRIQ
jgi:hypothetical protein